MSHKTVLIRIAATAVLMMSATACQPLTPSPVRTDVRVDDVALRAVLAYARSAEALDANARANEIHLLERKPVAPIQLMKLAMILGQNRADADPAKAAALLEKLLDDSTPDAAVFHPLARILHAQCLARVRLMGQAERLQKESRDTRDQMDSLQQKLDALTDIERSLPAPASRPTESSR